MKKVFLYQSIIYFKIWECINTMNNNNDGTINDETIFKKIIDEVDEKHSDRVNVNEYSPLVLAYVGDAVYELFIRTMVVSSGNAPVYKLHKYSTDYVKAKAQSETIHRIFENLTLEEQEIVRRGRNAKSATIPKNADIIEYKYATGLEALLGYLYLNRDYTRLICILKMCVDPFANFKDHDSNE